MTDREKLKQFTKEELIEAIIKISRWSSFISADHIVEEIKEFRRKTAFEKGQQARQHAIDCMQKYFDWRKRVIDTYGNGESVKLKDVPFDEVQKGAELEKKWKASEEARKKAEKEEDRY